MIAHLVLMNLHDISDSNFVTSEVLSLRNRVPGLVDITGGASILPNTWDLGFVMLFDSKSSTLAYQEDPAHVQIVHAIKELLSGMTTCDVVAQEPLQ